MHRLYLKIYASFLAIIALVAVLAPLGWWMFGPSAEDARVFQSLGKLAAHALPPLRAPMKEQQAAVSQLSQELNIRISLYSPRGRHIASSHRPLPPRHRDDRGWKFERKIGPVFTAQLPDGRRLVVAHLHPPRTAFGPVMLLLGFIVFSLGVYVLARRLTGRLERLQAGVERLGAGDLSARVCVEGKDEVAELASRFNETAERIETLVTAQKNMLATTSHELRTPLTRMRMALDLLFKQPDQQHRDELERNIEELDRLIDEILLSEKLNAGNRERRLEEIDLLGLLAEEAAYYDASIGGTPVMVEGEAHLLRRVIRNLLENARRYGESAIDAEVLVMGDHAVLRVCDRGAGVPEADRQRIFEPFYRPAHLAEGAHGGFGLGLSLVKQITEQHGGTIRCLPRDGGGSCFELKLPESVNG